MEHTTPFGPRLKRLRTAKGFTAEALGRKVGITENAVRKIESGSSKEPRFSTGIRLASALGTTPESLLGRRGDDAPELASVINQIRSCKAALVRLGIEHARVFGSVARGEAGPKSDVDVIIEPAASARVTLFDIVGVKDMLERATGRTVDVTMIDTIEQTRFAKAALADAVAAF